MKPHWDYIDPLPMEDFYRVRKGTQWGCVDLEYNLFVDYQWDFIGHNLGTLISVRKDNLWGLLRRDGTFAVECKWKSIICDEDNPHILILTNDQGSQRVPFREL